MGKYIYIARTYRTQRIKDARAEAAKEIDAYKAQKEEEFRRFQAEHSGASEKAEQEATKEAEAALHRIKLAGQQHGHTVVEDLIKGVTQVRLKFIYHYFFFVSSFSFSSLLPSLSIALAQL